MSESDDTLDTVDIADDDRGDHSEDCSSPSILTVFFPTDLDKLNFSSHLANASFDDDSNYAKGRKHHDSINNIENDGCVSPQYLPPSPKLQKIDNSLDDGALFVPSSCSPPSTQDESSQSSHEMEEEEKDEIFLASERVRDIERQADILNRLKAKGVSVKASKEFIDLKEKLIQVRMLLSSLTLAQDIDILNASKQDVGSLSSKQKRLVDLFNRCKDVVSRIQSLKRDEKVMIEDSDCSQIPPVHASALPGVYALDSSAECPREACTGKEEINEDNLRLQDDDQESVISSYPDLNKGGKLGEINVSEKEESFDVYKEQAQSLLAAVHSGKELYSTILQNSHVPTSTVSAQCDAVSTIGSQGNVNDGNLVHVTSSTLDSQMQAVTINTPVPSSKTASTPSLHKYAPNAQAYVILGNVPTLPTTHSTENPQRTIVVRTISLPVNLSTCAISCPNASSSTNSQISTIVRPTSLPVCVSSQQVLAGNRSAQAININNGTVSSQPATNITTNLPASSTGAASVQPTIAESLSQIRFVSKAGTALASATVAIVTKSCPSSLVTTLSLPTVSSLNAQVYSATTQSTQSVNYSNLSLQNVTGGMTNDVRTTPNTRSSADRTATYTTNLITTAPTQSIGSPYTSTIYSTARTVSLPTTVFNTSSLVKAKPAVISSVNTQTSANRSHDLPKTVPASRPVEFAMQKSTASSDKSNDYSKSGQRRTIMPIKKPDFTGRPEVDIATLLRHKVISPGVGVLSVTSQGRKFEASLKANGSIESTGGEIFHTPMAWLKAVTGSKTAARQPVAYSKIYYKDKPLAAFTIPSMSTAERADGNLQETPNGSSEAQEVQQVEKNIVSSFDLSKLLSANCKIHLISDNELIPTASILPHDFWSWNFDDIDIDSEWLDF